MRALIVVDIQNDFTTGGSLAVPEGERVIPIVNRIMTSFDLVVATQDWHPRDHGSFASTHPGKKPFEKAMLGGLEQVLWPDHCIQGTPGAAFHPQLNTGPIEAIFRKGLEKHIDSYSGFYDNDKRKSTGLAGYLRERKATHVFVCGLAADYCVFYTAKDALAEGFNATILEDATRAISTPGFDLARDTLTGLGGRVQTTRHL